MVETSKHSKNQLGQGWCGGLAGLEARAGELGWKKKDICVIFAPRGAYKQYELYIRLSGCIIKKIFRHSYFCILLSVMQRREGKLYERYIP